MDLPLPEMPENIEYGIMEYWLNEFHNVPEYQDRIMDTENLRWLYETYYSMVYDVDIHVGELLQILDNSGIRDNTIIIFASDHGDMMGHRGMVQKRCFYDRASKVPLIFSYPDAVNDGKRIKQLVSLIDLLPTLADMVEETAPAGLPGISMLPGIRSDIVLPDRPVFCEYHGEGVHAPCFMVRMDNFKYIYVHGHEDLLYDLVTDPGELNNISTEPDNAEIVSELRGLVLSTFNPDAIAVKALQSQQNRRYIFHSKKQEIKADNNPF